MKFSSLATVLALLGLAAAPAQATLPARHQPHALPLVEVAAGGDDRDTFVVLYSGDGGWAKSDRAFSTALAGMGLPVVGVDSLRYFWTKRNDGDASVDLTNVIDRYAGRWQKSHVVLAGYSFGAAALPQIAERLPPKERGMIRSVVLIAPTDYAYMVLRPGSWFNIKGPHAQPIQPSLAGLRGVRVVCIWGAKDKTAACPRLDPAIVDSRPVAGGHHFAGQYGAVAQLISDSAEAVD